MVSHGSTEDHKRNGNREFYHFTGPGGLAQYALRSHIRRSRQSAEKDIGPRPMCLLGSMGEVFWGSQARAGLVNSNKELGFGKAQEGLT